jgi:hypothetical protein
MLKLSMAVLLAPVVNHATLLVSRIPLIPKLASCVCDWLFHLAGCLFLCCAVLCWVVLCCVRSLSCAGFVMSWHVLSSLTLSCRICRVLPFPVTSCLCAKARFLVCAHVCRSVFLPISKLLAVAQNQADFIVINRCPAKVSSPRLELLLIFLSVSPFFYLVLHCLVLPCLLSCVVLCCLVLFFFCLVLFCLTFSPFLDAPHHPHPSHVLEVLVLTDATRYGLREAK